VATRSNSIVAELKKVQDSLGGGYLSAFPTEHFDRLQNLQPVWAPYYVASISELHQDLRSTLHHTVDQTHSRLGNGILYHALQIHKIMAGLLDQHTFAGNHMALQMVTNMAAYFGKRVDDTLQVNGTDHWHEMLNNEFGGMSEVLHNLYGITKDKEHLR